MSIRVPALIMLVLAVAMTAFYTTGRPDVEYIASSRALVGASVSAGDIQVPHSDRRGEDQTFLTIPEWYLVFSSAEYADVLKEGRSPATFPFAAHIGQFWSAYRAAWAQTRDRYAFNPGYHLMVMVIGVSTTVEYGCKAFWELSIGSLAEACSHGPVNEDAAAMRMADDYQRFIRIYPWYLYDFTEPLADVWNQPVTGIRSLERKYVLSTEYLVKSIYGWLLTKATGTLYGEAGDRTTCILKGDTTCTVLPRYEAFMCAADSIARIGRSFVDIAGNRSEIALGVIAPLPYQAPPLDGRIIIEQPILTKLPHARMVFTVAVASLAPALDTIRARGWVLEHIYDY